MPTIEDLLADLKKIPDAINEGVERAIIGDSHDVTQLNREQLEEGIDADGRKLGQYAESTKIIRRRRGLQVRFIDLNFTGKSVRGIDTEKSGDSYFLTANPQWDETRFPDAIGITDDNEDKLTEIIVDNIEPLLDKLFT